MLRAILASLCVTGLLLAPVVGADEPAPTPVQPAAPAPSAEQLLAWVGELGSDDFRQREQASQRLAQAGEAAREALESAATSSDSLEVRWRAQQLLLRLDGQRERQVEGLGGEPPRPGAVVPGRDDLRRLFEADTPEEVRELMDRLMQGFGRERGWPGFHVAPLEGMDLLGTRVSSGDLTLKLSRFGLAKAELEVRGQDAAGVPTRATYSGASLEAILEANPALRDHPSLPGLKQELEAAQRRRGLRGLEPGLRMPVFSFSTSEGIEFQQDASGVTVRVRERGPDGQIVTRELKGASLEELKARHPELAERLSAFHIRVAPPRVFRGREEEALPPLPLPLPEESAPQREEEPRFGVALEPVDASLASHLHLDRERAVLVREVLPGSQAAALGLQEFDVLESLDGRPLEGRADAALRLRAAAKDRSPLSLEILRGGQRQTLTR